MIFVFEEDGTLDIVEDTSEVNKNCEGVDVEREVYTFYDSKGRYLKPHFTQPNEYGKFLWIFNWCTSGKYELVPYTKANKDSLELCLNETHHLRPNKWFKDLNEVREYFVKQGIRLEVKAKKP